MRLIVRREHIDTAVRLFKDCGYGHGAVAYDKKGDFVVLTIHHDQLDTRKSVVAYLREEGINCK